MKEWTMPVVEELDINETKSGGNDYQEEIMNQDGRYLGPMAS